MFIPVGSAGVAICCALVLVILYWAVGRYYAISKNPFQDIPELRFERNDTKEHYISDCRSLLARGYEKYSRRGIPFQMRHIIDELGQALVLPMRYMDEVKNAPVSLFSFPTFSEKAWVLNHINAPQQTHAAAQVIKVNLNRNLGSLLSSLENEMNVVIEECLPDKQDWNVVDAYSWICQVVARVTALALVGPELCRDPEWLELSIGTTLEVFKAAYIVRDTYSPAWRWLAKWRDDAPKKVLSMRYRAEKVLRPYYKERLNKDSQESSQFNDALSWLLGIASAEKSLPRVADQQLFLTLASVHTTTATLTSILFDLIAHPKHQNEIIEEMRSAEDARQHKPWTLQSLGQMQKLDSFMKESQRVHPLGWIAGQRLALKSHTFKDGLHIPQGTTIMFPADGIHHDPEIYPDPNTFDPNRFRHLRQTIDPNRFHFSSVSDTSMFFGAGSHACPGRFFTAVVIKLALIRLCTNYHLRFDGEDQSRPVDKSDFMSCVPNAAAKIMLKRK